MPEGPFLNENTAKVEKKAGLRRAILVLFWLGAFVAIPFWSQSEQPGWDLHIYGRALREVRHGRDPYAAGIAIQDAYHYQHVLPAGIGAPPYTYVYSPMTLPLLRVAAKMTLDERHIVYWLLYIAGVLTMTWVGLQALTADEKKYLSYLGPAAAFFPGLLVYDVILSGNMVYIVYGAVLLAAWHGWHEKKWGWFYAMVLVASFCKPPLLTLLALPVLSARRQWLKAAGTGVLGVALFGLQARLWPGLFHNFMHAVNLQFLYNFDFGLSPAGMLGMLLSTRAGAYTTFCSAASTVFYLAYALVILAVLLVLGRRFCDGEYTLQEWMPVALLGTILLNPRVMTYDTAPLTLPIAIVLWRVVAHRTKNRWVTVAVAGGIFLAVNAIVLVWNGAETWKDVEAVVLVAAFVAGCVDLVRSDRDREQAA
jgi:hypothetical protein